MGATTKSLNELLGSSPTEKSGEGYTFYLFEDGETRLAVERWSDELETVLADSRCPNLFVTREWTRDTSLARLYRFRSQIESLVIIPREAPAGIEIVSELENLRHLRAICPVINVDFSKLRMLGRVEIGDKFGTAKEQRRPAGDLATLARAPSITNLTLNHVKLKDLSAVSDLESLSNFECNSATLESVAGIESLRNLTHLEINNAPMRTLKGIETSNVKCLKLIGLSKLERVATLSKLESLRELVFAGSTKVKDLDQLRHARLEVFAMIQCGRIASVGFLAGLSNLKEVELRNTVVDDGNLAVVTQMPRLSFARFIPYKKHYQPDRSEVERGE